MTITAYTYSIQNDFPNHMVDAARLTEEIDTSTIQGALYNIGTAGDVCTIEFMDALSGEDEATLDGLVAAHSGLPLPQPVQLVDLEMKQADNVPLVTLQPRLGKEMIDATGSFTDPTVWFVTSERVEDAALTQGVGSWWESGDVFIDMTHGKLFDENAHREDVAHGYHLVVKVDGVEKTQRAAFAASGGDYEADYLLGKVRPFTVDAWDGQTVTASYNKMIDSVWTLAPIAGKEIVIDKAEVQFSTDIEMNSSIFMDVYGFVDVFAPQYLQANGGPFAPGTKILIDSTEYKTVGQIIDEAVGAMPVIPAIGSGTGRGTQHEFVIMQFYYGAARLLFSCLGMDVRIRVGDDIPMSGERCTATFYCLIKPDPGIDQALIELGLA